MGQLALTAISVAFFGLEVHRILLTEVLPRALRGELVPPYSLVWNSFTALWHHLFLFEPELNPSPVVRFAGTLCVDPSDNGRGCCFSAFYGRQVTAQKRSKALEWSAFVPLLLLSSSMPASYHYCILIFTAVVGTDELLKITDKRKVLAFILLLLDGMCPGAG